MVKLQFNFHSHWRTCVELSSKFKVKLLPNSPPEASPAYKKCSSCTNIGVMLIVWPLAMTLSFLMPHVDGVSYLTSCQYLTHKRDLSTHSNAIMDKRPRRQKTTIKTSTSAIKICRPIGRSSLVVKNVLKWEGYCRKVAKRGSVSSRVIQKESWYNEKWYQN